MSNYAKTEKNTINIVPKSTQSTTDIQQELMSLATTENMFAKQIENGNGLYQPF